MSGPNNPETPKQRGWSFWSDFRQTQIIMAAISVLITIANSIIANRILRMGDKAAFIYFSYVGVYVMMPAMAIVRFCGWEPYFSGQGRGAEERFVCLVILTNALIGFLFGTLVGLPLKRNAKKNDFL